MKVKDELEAQNIVIPLDAAVYVPDVERAVGSPTRCFRTRSGEGPAGVDARVTTWPTELRTHSAAPIAPRGSVESMHRGGV